jgi:hypothetical protein
LNKNVKSWQREKGKKMSVEQKGYDKFKYRSKMHGFYSPVAPLIFKNL